MSKIFLIFKSLKKNGIAKYFSWFLILIECAIARILLIFVGKKQKYKNLWVFAERGMDARDNAMHLFRYVCRECPEINAVYVIDKNSPDLERVRKYGKIVYYGTFDHYMCYIASVAKISAHIFGGAPERNLFLRMDHVFLLRKIFIRGKLVFLQHGVTQADGPWLHRDKVRFDLFITVSNREEDFVVERFGHPRSIVKTLGFARYDALPLKHECTGKILLMPTWRHFLSGMSNEDFLKAEYFSAFKSFLESFRLNEILEKYNYDLIFYPHFEMQKYLPLFQVKNKRIIMASFKNFDVQNLMIESDLMITDFSSVQFDFAYMGKPIILYQFDRLAYQNGHQGVGYFDPDIDAFGPVVFDVDALLTQLETFLDANCQVSKVYKERMNSFFLYNDKSNCERNYNAIQEIL